MGSVDEIEGKRLKPCPFCGREHVQFVFFEDNGKTGFVLCNYCGARGPEQKI